MPLTPQEELELKRLEALEQAELKQLETREARQSGAQQPTGVKAALTGLRGATLGFIDELAGGAATAGMAGAYGGAGFANQAVPEIRPERAGVLAREAVRGATGQFEQESPGAAMAAEVGGAIATAPFSLGGAASRAGMGTLRRGLEFLKPVTATSAITAAGETEAEAPVDMMRDIALGTAEGTVYGAGFGLGGKGLGILGRQIGGRLPGIKEPIQINEARERLAQLLARDAEARRFGLGDPVDVAEARLRQLGPNAPLAATGQETQRELDLLANLPGSAQTLLERESRGIAKRRGPSIIESAETALDAQGVPFRATLQEFARRKQQQAAPFYNQLKNVDFSVDDELADLVRRSRKAFGTAEELALVGGMPEALNLGTVRAGDRIPFNVLDSLKRALYDIEEGAKGEFGKPTERSRSYTKLRRDLIRKLDELSPTDQSGQSVYRQAREAFQSQAQLETAMNRGRAAMRGDVEELSEIIDDLDPAELEAFRLGAAQALRDVAGGQTGQTRLLNMYKEPALQARLRTIFGNDFRQFQKTILQQEQLKKVERLGQGSQTFRRGAAAEDQAQFMDMMDMARAGQQGGLSLAEMAGRKYSQLRMPEETRNRLAKLLLLSDEPAEEELRNVKAYMERRRKQQALAAQLSGRAGAITAQE